MRRSLLAAALIGCTFPAYAENTRCGFDHEKEKYAGSEVEQARCLLPEFDGNGELRGKTKVRTSLGEPLESLVGKPVNLSRDKLREFVAGRAEVEGNLNGPLSQTVRGTTARYFVLHDTSSNVVTAPWPADNAPSMTRLGSKFEGTDIWKAHAWINRLGAIRITYDFGRRPTRSSTKFEIGHNSLWGLFLHTEITQPRKALASSPKNDKFTPMPAFKEPQYKSAALLYVIASVRAGTWLIPAYHIAIDEGLSEDSHDDPQYFDLKKFSAELQSLVQSLAP